MFEKYICLKLGWTHLDPLGLAWEDQKLIEISAGLGWTRLGFFIFHSIAVNNDVSEMYLFKTRLDSSGLTWTRLVRSEINWNLIRTRLDSSGVF